MAEEERSTTIDFGDDDAGGDLPEWVNDAFSWVWSAVTGTTVGFITFVVLIYVIPYGLGLAAIGTQATSGGDFAVLAFAALIASTYASTQPAPTPLLGTLSLVLTGFLGANFEPLVVGGVAGVAATLGLVTSYGVGATGVGRLLIGRVQSRPGVMAVVERAFATIRRRGAWAILLFAAIPNPATAWSSVAAGVSRMPFGPYVLAALVGSLLRHGVVAYIGKGIEKLVS